jgi:diguanylate cyclase (GGDEF)-like protein
MASLHEKLTEDRVRQSIGLAGITADDLVELKDIHRALVASPPEAWRSLDQFIDCELPRLINSVERRELVTTVLKDMFRAFAGASVSFEEICNRLQVWLDMQYFGMPPEWPALAHEQYLRAAVAELTRIRWERSTEAHNVLRKFVILHLGLATAALIHSEQEHYRQQLFYDAGTKLPGPELFLETLDQRIAENTTETKEILAVMLLETVSSHRLLGYPGYPTVDQYMSEVAGRLKPALRPRDFLARLGRQEFGIVLPNLRSEGQAMLAANKLLGTLQTPILLETTEISPQPSLGIVIFPEHGQDSQTLIRLAETACTAAKSSPEPYVIYQSQLDQGERLQRTMESELRSALRENELMLFYQPQLSLKTNIVHGAEALLRWKNQRGEFIPPNIIVDVAERCGMMTELTQWVMNTALRHSAEMRLRGIDITLSVNLSAQDLVAPEFVEITDQTLRTWGVPADKLLLEITEGSMISEVDKVHGVLTRLKAVGVEISIDDFGTGYSSLAYLKRLPLDELKIDQVFVRNMLKDRQDERIVRTIIDLAHNLQLRVVAEGVEDDATMLVLKQMHCDVAQGYCLSRPKPLDEFSAWWLERAKQTQ